MCYISDWEDGIISRRGASTVFCYTNRDELLSLLCDS